MLLKLTVGPDLPCSFRQTDPSHFQSMDPSVIRVPLLLRLGLTKSCFLPRAVYSRRHPDEYLKRMRLRRKCSWELVPDSAVDDRLATRAFSPYMNTGLSRISPPGLNSPLARRATSTSRSRPLGMVRPIMWLYHGRPSRASASFSLPPVHPSRVPS